jgi:hypothetical protein
VVIMLSDWFGWIGIDSLPSCSFPDMSADYLDNLAKTSTNRNNFLLFLTGFSTWSTNVRRSCICNPNIALAAIDGNENDPAPV